VLHHYTSNIYKKVEEEYKNIKYSDRYLEFIDKGYKIISPNLDNYNQIMEDIYYLITKLYSDFPIYKHLSDKFKYQMPNKLNQSNHPLGA
jgi:hypothetical protein